MPENSSENAGKNAEKFLKNRVNPHGMGVMRFSLLEILLVAPLPLTVSEIEQKLCELHGQVHKPWVRRVIREMQLITGTGIAVKSIEKRVGLTKCPAYYIIKPNPQRHV